VIKRCNIDEVIIPVCNTTNDTIPTPPPSGNETTPPENITIIQNCSFYKVCRSRPRCLPDDYNWWNQYNYGDKAAAYVISSSDDSSDSMDYHTSMSQCGCSSCGCE